MPAKAQDHSVISKYFKILCEIIMVRLATEVLGRLPYMYLFKSSRYNFSSKNHFDQLSVQIYS